MPGPHVELKIVQCFLDVGGCDAWQGGYWDQGGQWWTGWHLAGPSGLPGLMEWSWPNPGWDLIGYERWEHFRKGDRLIEALYCDPNPSTTRYPGAPHGHWHVWFHPNGQRMRS